MSKDRLMTLQPGTIIAGRYEVVKCLGAGSMGLVYACRHRELTGHMVAVKVLFPEVANDKIAAARFRNEIFASYGVSHPNVVRAYEYLRDGDLVAYTMEFVAGGDLASKLENGEWLPIPDCIKILCQMCAGVQAIHDAGIVHRDLKPENILLTKDGDVKIADFGIARTDQGPKLTEHGGVLGTIEYVSPEYMLNSQVDWRSDIYAMGILAYEMVTGQPPFKGDSVYETMTKRLKTDAAPPSSINPDCPEALDAVILRMMHRSREERYQSAADIFADLAPLSQDNGGQGRTSAMLNVQKRKSENYVGPSLQQQLAADQEAEEEVVDGFDKTQVISNVQRDALSKSARQAQPAKSGPQHSSGSHETEPGGYGRPEVIEISTHYRPASSGFVSSANEAGVTYADLVARQTSSGGTAEKAPAPVLGSSLNLDVNRMQRLSQIAQGVERSIWMDVATFVIIIIIGLGLGVFVLKAFFPEFLGLSALQMGPAQYLVAGDQRTAERGELVLSSDRHIDQLADISGVLYNIDRLNKVKLL